MIIISAQRSLINPYFINTIGLLPAFQTFFKSYYNSHKLVRLNESEDSILLTTLRSTINETFPIISNELEPKFIYKFYNACHRQFGRVAGHPSDQAVLNEYPKPEVYASDFFPQFEKCLVQFALAIQEFGTTDVKLANYQLMAEMLLDLRSIIINNKFNEVEQITHQSIKIFALLLNLIRDDDLMVKRLKIRSTDEADRIKEFCQLVGTPVAENPREIIELAGIIEIFVIQIESTQWNQDLVKPYVEDPSDRQAMIRLINSYSMVTGVNIFGEAEKMRNQRTR